MRKAFTLIELLVVISIIALLIAILLPARCAAKRNARLMQCTTHIRGMGQVLNSHATDNDSILVHPNWDKRYEGWLYNTIRPDGTTYSAPKDYAYQQRIDLRQTGVFWDYLGGVGEVYHCPDDDVTEDIPTQPVRVMTSYQLNGALCAYKKQEQTFSIDSFQGEAIFTWETYEKSSGGFWNDGANYPDEGLSDRHVDGAPFGRIDGSTIKVTKVQYDEWVADPQKNALWCNPETKDGRD